MDPDFRKFIGDNVLKLDLINIEPLDDLHQPHGMIEEAQKLAAEAFGADATFFSVQGTSGAIMAMVMSVCGPGDKIIVPRNVHKSVMSAIVFSGAVPVFIHPEVDPLLGISHGITPASVSKALKQHPDAKAVLVINPTYYGISADLNSIVDISHACHVPVLVDEAHGVHIHFDDELPVSAMQAGADMAATSVHKLGGSLTQSSILNLKEGLVSKKTCPKHFQHADDHVHFLHFTGFARCRPKKACNRGKYDHQGNNPPCAKNTGAYKRNRSFVLRRKRDPPNESNI